MTAFRYFFHDDDDERKKVRCLYCHPQSVHGTLRWWKTCMTVVSHQHHSLWPLGPAQSCCLTCWRTSLYYSFLKGVKNCTACDEEITPFVLHWGPEITLAESATATLGVPLPWVMPLGPRFQALATLYAEARQLWPEGQIRPSACVGK